jgi:hypothetical protein
MKCILTGLLLISSVSAFSMTVKTSITIEAIQVSEYDSRLTAVDGKTHTLHCDPFNKIINTLVYNALPGSFGVLQQNDGAIVFKSNQECQKLRKLLDKETSKGNTVTILANDDVIAEVIINK